MQRAGASLDLVQTSLAMVLDYDLLSCMIHKTERSGPHQTAVRADAVDEGKEAAGAQDDEQDHAPLQVTVLVLFTDGRC